ncbi:MAG: hypothetical protein H7834_08870 [Magnetococcus sp. YQC-9]
MTLARSSKEAFFAIFAKNAPRAAFAGFVSVFWKRSPHLARSLAEKIRIPKWLRYQFV